MKTGNLILFHENMPLINYAQSSRKMNAWECVYHLKNKKHYEKSFAQMAKVKIRKWVDRGDEQELRDSKVEQFVGALTAKFWIALWTVEVQG
jgi:hypothetical protein